MKKINISTKKYLNAFTIIDDEDFEWLNEYKWYINCGGYVTRFQLINGKRKQFFMHREILNTPENFRSDHINGNKLDNRKKNLRVATQQQNCFNRKQEIRNKSGYKGVCWSKQRKKWMTRIEVNNKKIYLGFFDNKLEAANAYNKGAIKYHGEFARLNQI